MENLSETQMNKQEIIERIEALMVEFAAGLSDEEYLEALEEMADRSTNVINALREDMERKNG